MLAAAVSASAQSRIGYTTGNMSRNTVSHYGKSRQQGMAIRLSHEKLQPLAGQDITSIRTAFGSANAVVDKKATFFVATQLGGAPVIEQAYTIGQANRWCDVTLATPYHITGDEPELVIGYTLTATSDNIPEALQTDHTNDLLGCSFGYDGEQWADLYGSGLGCPNLYLNLSGNVTFTDAMLAEVDCTDNYYRVGQQYEHKTHIFNFGTEPIRAIDVTMQMGGEAQHFTYDGLNIAQFGTYEFALPTLSASETGSTTIDVSVTVNAATEACSADNAFQTTAFFYPDNMERTLLIEEFTGMTCGNCPGGQRTLHAALTEAGYPYVQIMHHAGYAADFWSSDADFDYTMYYGSTSTYAPAAMINRVVNPAVSAVPVMNVASGIILPTLDYAAARQPYVSLGLRSDYDAATRDVKVTLDILAHNDLPGQTLINAFLIQDGIVGYQANGGTDYEHNGLLRRVLTGNSWGLLLPDDFCHDQHQQWTTSFTLPEAIQSDFWTPELLAQAGYTPDIVTFATEPAKMRIVAYVANYDPTHIGNNAVYNCIEVPLVGGHHTQAALDIPEALQTIGEDRVAATGIFDLQGRRLNSAAKGLVIVNGQKQLLR